MTPYDKEAKRLTPSNIKAINATSYLMGGINAKMTPKRLSPTHQSSQKYTFEPSPKEHLTNEEKDGKPKASTF